MKLKFITCSGANEHTHVDVLFALFRQFSCIEFGIQVSGQKCGEDSPRLDWLRQLRQQILVRKIKLPLALHLNQDWVTGFCQGEIAPELQELLSYCYPDGEPMFKRVQLNFKIGREVAPEVYMLETQIMKFPYLRFILSYNEANAKLVKELYSRKKVVFDCLYDESFGEGLCPEKRHAPVFADIMQGYAGGLSSENVAQELDKMVAVLPKDAEFFIDAEGKLKGEDGHFSFAKAHDFLANVCAWQEKNI